MNALELAERLSPDRETVLRIDAEHAGELLRRQHEALQHYEKALIEAFPQGAQETVFEHWNKARKALKDTEDL